ncbi:MAG: sulfatase [Planctomycetes bacterium]|nr:sulfatase [Planctomycetota bacterium]
MSHATLERTRGDAWSRAAASPAAALLALGFLVGSLELLLHATWHPGRSPLGLEARGWLRASALALLLYALIGAACGLVYTACCGGFLARRGARADNDARRGAGFLFAWIALALELVWWSRFARLSGESFFTAGRLLEAALLVLLALPLAVLAASAVARLGARLAGLCAGLLVGLLLLSAILPPREVVRSAVQDSSRGTSAARPSVLLIVVDALRADRASSPALMPRLHSLAERGTRFSRAYTAAPSTWPALASLFTGKLPSEHGLLRMSPDERLRGIDGTLAEALRSRGHRTAALVSGSLANGSGLLRGFDELFELSTGRARFALDDPWSVLRAELAPLRAWEKLASKRDEERVASEAAHFLGEVGEQPFFLYVHLYATHVPYEPPRHYRERVGHRGERTRFTADEARAIERGELRPSAEEWQEIRSLYDACAAWSDDQLGRILDALAATPQGERTLVVVTADHGEELGEHAIDGLPCVEHDWMWNSSLAVPLVIAGPGVPERATLDAVRSHVDLQETLVRLVEGREPTVRDLLRAADDRDHAISENSFYRVAQERRWKLLRERSGERRERVIEVALDPAEAAAFDPALRAGDAELRAAVERLRARLEALPADGSSASQGENAIVDPAVEQALRAAGYLGGTRPRSMFSGAVR